ncbi:NUDIX domain-containing protein [Streptomyces sp. NPDC058700]|uniref:NUDIX hydrolase n=1 Tax=Streptomyces sp. NPDC058700 TaxID=3346607 RepID=UPI003667DD06
MDVIDAWDGRRACLLQEALRMTQEDFAEFVEVSVRTVGKWHSSRDGRPRTDVQKLLDAAYKKASPDARQRFHLLARGGADAHRAQAFRVAVAVVTRDSDVLLVCRRGDDSLSWQFPAGTVKPGRTGSVVAVEETRAETGVRCAVRQRLGERVHPKTGVLIEYHLADYLMGDAENLDVEENIEVAWIPRRDLTRFIPEQQIYPPILEALA